MTARQDSLALFSDDRNGDAAELIVLNDATLGDLLDGDDAGVDLLVRHIGPDPETATVAGVYRETLFESDATQPLSDEREEHFVQVLVASRKGEVAYQTAFNPNCTVRTARQQASRKRKIPRIRARLIWLHEQEVKKQKRQDGGEDEPGDEAPAKGGRMTRQDKLRFCEQIMKNKQAPWSERVRAMDIHTKLESGEEGAETSLDDLDPVELAELFRRAEEQGQDVVSIARAADKKQEDL